MRGLSPCLGFGCSVSVRLSMPSVPPSSDQTPILIQARTLLTLSTCHTVLLSTNAGQGLGMSSGWLRATPTTACMHLELG